MKLTFTIEITDVGVKCSGEVNGQDCYSTQQANLMAVGALSIAHSSLLAQRWGMSFNNPLIKEE